MEDQSQSSGERLRRAIEADEYDEAAACLRGIGPDADDRRAAIRTVRAAAADDPAAMEPLLPAAVAFLTDDERSVRLRTAKLFVTVARASPSAAAGCVDALAERVADETEFYYVRARSAEALGYVALEHPTEVASPELLADLRIGLSFDEPEVKEKLAKALAYVALGDPGRLRHQVDSLADHTDDADELVRYHLCTALVAVGCAHPAALADADDGLRERLADENPYVRGRAAEALALLTGSDEPVEAVPEVTGVDDATDAPSFLCDRVAFLRGRLDGETTERVPDEVGTLEAVRSGTDDVVEEILSPAGDEECPSCGLELPENGPPMCPRCGSPH